MHVLVVGAGFAGSVCAERLAASGHYVTMIDRRSHVAGNAFDEADDHGVLIHRYGPHVFHTNAPRIWEYLSHFTAWRPYEHRVLAEVRGQLLPVPINRTTLNLLYGLDLDEAGAAAFLLRVREPREHLLTSEDVVLSTVGRELGDLFFRGYTRKQWGLDLSQLSSSVLARIPVRTGDDDLAPLLGFPGQLQVFVAAFAAALQVVGRQVIDQQKVHGFSLSCRCRISQTGPSVFDHALRYCA